MELGLKECSGRRGYRLRGDMMGWLRIPHLYVEPLTVNLADVCGCAGAGAVVEGGAEGRKFIQGNNKGTPKEKKELQYRIDAIE